MSNLLIDLKTVKDRIANYNVYRNYKAFMKHYLANGEDLSYDDSMVEVIETIATDYAKMEILPYSLRDTSFSPQVLDNLAKERFSDFFKGSSHFIFHSLLNKKIIDPNIPIAMSDMLNREVYLQKYESADDLITAIYQIIHTIAYQGDKRIVYLETFPQAFRLIVASILDEIIIDGKFVEYILKNQIESLVYNIYLNLLYPSLTQIFMPYSVGLYLANEIYLNYKNNRDDFITGFNAVTSKEISMEEYLKQIGADMSLENIEKIKEHHQIILK